MLKLKEKNIDESISIKDMRVGQIGIITEWDDHNINLGKIIIKTKNILVSLNDDSSWEMDFIERKKLKKLRVKILPNGTELVICNNE